MYQNRAGLGPVQELILVNQNRAGLGPVQELILVNKQNGSLCRPGIAPRYMPVQAPEVIFRHTFSGPTYPVRHARANFYSGSLNYCRIAITILPIINYENM